VPHRIQLSRAKGWRKPPGAIVVARPTRWGNPFRYHDQLTGLVRYLPGSPDYEHEGRISTDGMVHPYFHPDGHVTAYHVRWATRTELVELFRRTVTEPDRGMVGAYPSRQGHFLRVSLDDIRRNLSGHDLACWCPLTDADGQPVPCHADVLLALANPGA
jgi:hypothetical protein